MKVTGVIHMHSTHSYDGKVPLLELKTILLQRGISFCCITEHSDTLTAETTAALVAECKALSDQTFVFVPGLEVPYKDAHILFIGADVFHGQFADAEILLRYKEVSSLVVLAHPVRNCFEVDDTLLSVLDGVEVWNQQYEGKLAPRFRSLALLKKLQTQKPELLATGGLDFHRVEHLGTPLVALDIDVLTVEEITRKLRLGLYTFGSDGVRLDAKGVFESGAGMMTQLQSSLSIGIISLGKTINAMLASLGWRLPSSFRRFLRSRV